MTKKTQAAPQTSKPKKEPVEPQPAKPWISMKTGLRVVTAASIIMAVLTAWQSIPTVGWGKGILWGVIFGAMLWAVFGLMQLFYRWMR
jgi:hypothetical protein